MDLEMQTLGTTELTGLFPRSEFSPATSMSAVESGIIDSIYDDDKASLIAHSKLLLERHSESLSDNRSITSRLLHFCCVVDSADCVAALLNGEVGPVPLVNKVDEAGVTPLHVAAEHHSSRCVELLLRKRARTEIKTRDGRGQLALELSLSSPRLGVIWNPEDYSVEDLVVLIGEKDLTTIRLISEKTKEVAEVACAKAVEGNAVALTILLVVAAERINELTRLNSGPEDKATTIYESVVREALSLGRETTTSLSSSSSSSFETLYDTSSDKRKIMLAEIELLQLFGVVARCPDKKVKPLLARAVQGGDEVVAALLLQTGTDMDETDMEGNSALHYCLKPAKASSPPGIKMLKLLLDHGAQVSQKNKLGLTALHLAAGNGHLQALEILLLENPEGINDKTEMKETPLFFAVKNNHLDCAEFLLRWGANSEVLNIRQRPIDLAKSQDMRFMLNPTNIGLMNRNFHGHQKYGSWLQDDEDECATLVTRTDDCITSERCVREGSYFYSHFALDRGKFKPVTHKDRRSPQLNLKKRIFVGGLPHFLTSASLQKFFEENFGPVEDAKILVSQTGSQTQSRGFGFVTFKDEKHVSAAIQAHYVFIMDKQVEIKSVLPPGTDLQKLAQQDSEVTSDKHQVQAKVLNEGQEDISTTFECREMPTWLRIFKKWLPIFLRGMAKHTRDGEYALSSLKGDFRAKFGLELDHASLGYSKLSDFMKCFSDLCSTRVLPIGRTPNHMVLLPKSVRSQMLLRRLSTINSIICNRESYSNDSMSTLKDHTSEISGQSEEVSSSREFSVLSLSPVAMSSSDAQPMFLQLLEQDPLFHIRPWLQTEYYTSKGNTFGETEGREIEDNQNKHSHRPRHKVLEALAKSRPNPSHYFLREFDFYSNYNNSIKDGKCFACSEREVLWANFPCQHLLWCVDCKTQASLAAGSLPHKCVVCDAEVHKVDLLTSHDYRQLVGQYIFNEEFPPLELNQIRSL